MSGKDQDWRLVDGCFYAPYLRDDSRWVNPSRTDEKSSYPYSYSEFFLFGGRQDAREANDALYSDRIWQWDRDKASRLWKEHVDGQWAQAGSKKLSSFLSAYLDKPVKVTALAEGCNISNGYPYWIVWFKHEEKSK